MAYKNIGDIAEHTTERGVVRTVVVRQGDLHTGAIILNEVVKDGRVADELLIVEERDPVRPSWLMIRHLVWSDSDARWTPQPGSLADDGRGFFNYHDGYLHPWRQVIEADDAELQALLDAPASR